MDMRARWSRFRMVRVLRSLWIWLASVSLIVFWVPLLGVVWLLDRDPLKLLWYSILINSFTNPLMNYIYNYEMRQLYLLELAVAAVEAILIRHLLEIGYKEALIFALAGNLASLLIGLLVFG